MTAAARPAASDDGRSDDGGPAGPDSPPGTGGGPMMAAGPAPVAYPIPGQQAASQPAPAATAARTWTTGPGTTTLPRARVRQARTAAAGSGSLRAGIRRQRDRPKSRTRPGPARPGPARPGPARPGPPDPDPPDPDPPDPDPPDPDAPLDAGSQPDGRRHRAGDQDPAGENPEPVPVPWPDATPFLPPGPAALKNLQPAGSGFLDLRLHWLTLTRGGPEPGYLTRLGPITPAQASYLALLAAADPAVEWRAVVTDPDGRVLAVTRIRTRRAPSRTGPGQPQRSEQPPAPRHRDHQHRPAQHCRRQRPARGHQPRDRGRGDHHRRPPGSRPGGRTSRSRRRRRGLRPHPGQPGLPGPGPDPRIHQPARPDLPVPHLPPARPALRRRPHQAVRPGRPDLPVQPRMPLPLPSSAQATPAMAPRPARTRHLHLDHPHRTHISTSNPTRKPPENFGPLQIPESRGTHKASGALRLQSGVAPQTWTAQAVSASGQGRRTATSRGRRADRRRRLAGATGRWRPAGGDRPTALADGGGGRTPVPGCYAQLSLGSRRR